MIMWRVWSVRNKVTRAGEALSIDDSVEFLQRFMAQFQLANETKIRDSAGQSSCRRGTGPSNWNPPTRDAIKINVDGAFNPRAGGAAVGVIARDHESNPHVMAWRLLFHCRDAGEAEALAVLEGLSFVGRWSSDTPVETETDCANLAAKVMDYGIDRSVSSALIVDIKSAISRLNSCFIHKAGRDQNEAAHKLAQHALQTLLRRSPFLLYCHVSKTLYNESGWFNLITTRKTIYRNTCYSFLVWADTVPDMKNELLFFVSADLINRYKKYSDVTSRYQKWVFIFCIGWLNQLI
jgi:ribonuclease HI